MMKPVLRIAYLTAVYPKVSHTFIRREIVELESRGHYILRLAIRNAGDAIAEGVDAGEAKRTIHVMSLRKIRIVGAVFRTVVTRPLRSLSAACKAIRISRVSDRGILRHFAYFLEAAVLLQITLKHQIQHVHVHFGTNSAAVAYLMRSMGGPRYSMTVHGPLEFDSPVGFSLAQKAEEAAFVVAISDYCLSQLYRWMPPDQWSKVHVVRCSAGPSYFDLSAPVEAESNLLLSIGRLDTQKGQLLLLDAVKRVLDAGTDLRLVLVGDGEMREVMEERIKSYGLTKQVSITGWLDERQIKTWLEKCRALVQPSFAEGLPVVIMEAFASGRPVISTYVAGIPELVQNTKNGWLVPAGNVDKLVLAISEALALSADELTQMGLAGRESARARHNIEIEATKLEELLMKSIQDCAEA